MRQLIIFGKNYIIKEQESDKDYIELKDNIITTNHREKTTGALLKDFMTQTLSNKIAEMLDEIKAEGKIELFGDLDFEITENIDNKRHRIAKLKGRKILVKLNAITLPENALKYIVAHEIAHIGSKQHTRKFWKTIKIMYPEYEEAKKLLNLQPN